MHPAIDEPSNFEHNCGMLLLGIIAFGVNWILAWGLIRGNPGPAPLAIMTTATSAITFAMGIVISMVMIQLGTAPQVAIGEAMDVAIYFGLPAAAFASYCASHQNRQDMQRRTRR